MHVYKSTFGLPLVGRFVLFSEVIFYRVCIYMSRAIYIVFDLAGHFVLATQGLLGHCTLVMEIMS